LSFGQSTIWSVEKWTADDTSDTCRWSATAMAFVLSAAVYGPKALLANGLPTPKSCSERSFNCRCTCRPQSKSSSARTRGPDPSIAATPMTPRPQKALFIVTFPFRTGSGHCGRSHEEAHYGEPLLRWRVG